MGKTLTHKILEQHLVEGTLASGQEIGIRIDQTLTQDATGTTAFLLFEAMGLDRVRTDLSVSYVDHNMAMNGPENHNDHVYLQSIAPKVGAYHSRPGNGICHQVHLERFAVPGKTLLGSDSHTPTCGGMGMLAIGAGGMDVAVAMGGGPFFISYPKVIGVHLTGELQEWVASKDIIFKLLSILSTKGNVGCIVEYFGPGVACLNVPARSTCTNMGAELGVTTSVFPSDEVTRDYLAAQGREDVWQPLTADDDPEYDQVIEIDLNELEPLCAAPGSPDNIEKVADQAGTRVDQVLVGSCTNSSYQDLMTVAKVLEGKHIHPHVEFGVAPGSRQVFNMIAANGALATYIAAGARVLESACGPCIGQGQSPGEGRVSLRSFNRNFTGRSGTKNDSVYLVSPETAAAAAITGQFTDPRKLTEMAGIAYPAIANPEQFLIDDGMIVPPLNETEAATATVDRGPTIVKPPTSEVPPEPIDGQVLIKVGDKITTDHIMPAGTALKYRSNVPEYAKFVYLIFNEDGQPSFYDKAMEVKNDGKHGIIVGGDSYGQGSSREHAALCPMFLGVRVVLAKAIERIHNANLINFGIVPLTFADPVDYDGIDVDDNLSIGHILDVVRDGDTVTVQNASKGSSFEARLTLSQRQRNILLAGGLLQYTAQTGGQTAAGV